MPNFGDLEKKIVSKSLQMYTKYFKDVVSTFSMLILILLILLMLTDPPLFTIEMDTFASFDLDLFIAYRNGKRSYTQHAISNYIFYDCLTPTISLVCYVCLFYFYT